MSVQISKWIKAGAAVLLLPLCLGTAQTIFEILRVSSRAETFWVAMVAGAACWLAVYLTLPQPMWVYVLGHELTHALWAYLMGGRVKRLKVTSKGGHVVVTRTNFLIALAPYFFPFYAVLVTLVFAGGDWLWGWSRYRVWFHLALGAAYAFHLTLTWSILQTRQSDITNQGYFFSAVVIWLGNATILLLSLPRLSGEVAIATALTWCWNATVQVLQRIANVL